MILNIALPLIAGLAVLWLALLVVLLVAKPDTSIVTDTLWIVPDTIRLIRRLTTDKTLHRDVRARLRFVAAYVALPVDVVPNFIPVLGYADDSILMALTLRTVVRHAGIAPIQHHWSGTREGLSALARLCRLPELEPNPNPPRPDVLGEHD
jgi:uncharacterized membrane protein YkvA (DUF1232 family)